MFTPTNEDITLEDVALESKTTSRLADAARAFEQRHPGHQSEVPFDALLYSDIEDMLDEKMGKMVALLTRLDVANADIVRRLAKIEKLVKKLDAVSDLSAIPENPLERTDYHQQQFLSAVRAKRP